MRRIAVSVAAVVGAIGTQSAAEPPSSCARTYTVKMAERGITATYRGHRNVTLRDRSHVARWIKCQRHPYNQPKLEEYLERAKVAWNARRYDFLFPVRYAVASWYDDAGGTACGFHATYGVASPAVVYAAQTVCGEHVVFYYHGRSVEATVDDAGPFIPGRSWDLNQNTAGALGFSGVDTVGYRLVP